MSKRAQNNKLLWVLIMRGLIFGATKIRAEQRMEKLIQDYKNYWNIEPEKIRKSSNEYSVIFTNGDYWQAYKLHDSCRGRKANVILIDKEIDNTYIAEYCLINKPYGSISYY